MMFFFEGIARNGVGERRSASARDSTDGMLIALARADPESEGRATPL
jgi:hypothetical protein